MLKKLKRMLIWIAIIIALLVGKRFYEDYRFVQNWQRAQDMLGQP
jgi:hypothetical protein